MSPLSTSLRVTAARHLRVCDELWGIPGEYFAFQIGFFHNHVAYSMKGVSSA